MLGTKNPTLATVPSDDVRGREGVREGWWRCPENFGIIGPSGKRLTYLRQ